MNALTKHRKYIHMHRCIRLSANQIILLLCFKIFNLIWILFAGETNLPPVFTQTLNNIVLYENVPVGTVVFRLEGSDPEDSNVTFGSIGSDHFSVDPVSGNITLVKPLDREETDSLTFLVSIRDQVDPAGESEQDNVVQQPITFIILDENDNPPEFQNVNQVGKAFTDI